MRQLKQVFSLLIVLFISVSINAQESNTITHTLVKGQTLYSISRMYQKNIQEIIEYNPGSEKSISVGQLLRIPQEKGRKIGKSQNR